MDALRDFLEKKLAPSFKKGGRLEFFYPIFEMIDTIAFTPATVTSGSCHVRDGIDQKRIMITVVIALVFPMIFGIYNIGFQATTIIEGLGLNLEGWRIDIMQTLGLALTKSSIISNFVYGLLYFLPIFLVVITVGGICEVIFALIRRHEVAEAFLVTSFLITLTMPPNVPLWQVAIATAFGVVIGKEIFGGVGFNLLNPALTARAFLFFAYPASMSGDAVWVAVDGVTMATPLGVAALNGVTGDGGLVQAGFTLRDAFLGFIPGSIGETSTFACILGFSILYITGIGSWRIMLSVLLGMVATVLFFNLVQPYVDNPMFELSPFWHLSLGGYAFGLVYMATDPVSASMTFRGQFFYGLFIGILVSLIRVVNPAYPEGMMLAILFMNVFAPLIDHVVVQGNIKKRLMRYGINGINEKDGREQLT